VTEPDIASVAGLLGDPSRAAMCLALMGGEARPAGELATLAGVSPQTASNHLAKLTAGRLLCAETQGRWRYYRLADAEVAHAVEALAVVAPPLPGSAAGANGADGTALRLKEARTRWEELRR
jgi:DNA-binding transcriptional ArsR family regulator